MEQLAEAGRRAGTLGISTHLGVAGVYFSLAQVRGELSVPMTCEDAGDLAKSTQILCCGMKHGLTMQECHGDVQPHGVLMRYLLALLLIAPFAQARSRPDSTGNPYSPSKLAGAPDVPTAGDHGNAWASLYADQGKEWVKLEYAKAVKIAEIRIRENDAPGAVVRVVAIAKGEEVVLWSGKDPTRVPLTDFVIKPAKTTLAKTIRIELDTTRVSGWNEIDAVELIGADGSHQWVKSATASSSYDSVGSSGWSEPLTGAVGKSVEIGLVGGGRVKGHLKTVGTEYLTVKVGDKTRLVRRDTAAVITY